ncbi:MAG TPA: response regulator [Anaeromyxobacteraceae bacterium]|nr:response regulator [Anaeromyxobacteraceae bacterium]
MRDGERRALKVLIADDDRLIRTMVTDLLLELGHEVVAAENGVEAVERCAEAAPDLLVLDFLMPRLSGLDALRRIRAAGSRAPAVLLTAISDGSLRGVEGADAVDAVLEKPVSRRALERALSRALGAR